MAVALPQRRARSGAAWPVLGALAGGLVVVALVVARPDLEATTTRAVLAGIALMAVLALAIVRFDAAVLLGMVLFAVVKFEPAPSDGIFALVIAVAAVTGRLHLRRVPTSILVAVGVLLALNVASVPASVDLTRALKYAGITFYLCFFGLWLTGYVDSPTRARTLVRAYVWVAVLSAVAGVLALNFDLPFSSSMTRYGGTRASALFKDPNVFGPFLVPAALFVLEDMVRPRMLGLPRWVKALMFVALLAGVLFSFSRAAWLNTVVALAVFVVVLALRPGGLGDALRVVAVLVVAAAVAAGLLTAVGSDSFFQERASLQSYDTNRFNAQREGIEYGLANPLGIGPGQFEELQVTVSHSTHIRTFSEQGPGGLLSWLTIVLATTVFALLNVWRGRDTHGIGSAALLAAWLGMLANSFFIDSLHWRHLWFVVALIWAGTRVRSATRPAT